MTVCHAIYHVLVIYHQIPRNSCSLLPATTWAVCMPFVKVHFSAICYSSTACYTVCYVSVATCCTVCYLLLHAIQFAICCRIPYSSLTCCRTPYSFFKICCHMLYSCYLLPHAIQFAICCRKLYSCFLLPHAVQLLFVAACCTVCYFLPHAVQFATCCRMPYSLLFVVASCTTCCCNSMLQNLLFIAPYHACSSLFVAACLTVGY